MRQWARKAFLGLVWGAAVLLAACGGGGGGNGGGSGGNPPGAPTVTVTPSANSISISQSLQVTVGVSGSTGSGVPTGTVTISSGSYSSAAATLSSGNATITVQAGKLAVGSNTLIATYAPDGASSSTYKANTGTGLVAITVATPTVTVTPGASSVGTAQALGVTVTVAGYAGGAVPSGSVRLGSGGYTSGAQPLTNGSASISIPGGSLTAGSARLTVTYSPDSAGSAVYASGSGSATVTVTPEITPTVTVSPASQSVVTSQPLNVTVKVSGPNGSATPSGAVVLNGMVLSSGNYQSAATVLSNGTATIAIPAYSLGFGSATLSAVYTPDAQSSGIYNGNTQTATVSVARATPTVTVTPALTSIDTSQALDVTVAVSGPGTGAPAASGTVKLSSGSYSSMKSLTSGSASITIAAGALAAGSDTLSAAYTPDATGSAQFNSANGTSAAVSVVIFSTVTVNQSTTLAPVTDQLMGLNLAAWYDDVANAGAINTAFGKAGIKAIRWPGGSWSDAWHWRTSPTNLLPYMCSGVGTGTSWGGYSSFADFVTSIAKGGSYDLALTANYGSNETCNGGGNPAESAAWAAEALSEGYPASHMTVGNENYGSWEYDLHARQWDAATYANSVIGNAGYYKLITTASPTTKVGVVVDGGGIQANWDSTVLSAAKGAYDFVEFHFYAQNPGNENDTYLVHQAATDFTTSINRIKTELTTAGAGATPIYVGEMGSVSSLPGKQSWSISQGLYAGQMLGEMMNAGVTRATWWIGFGNCDEDDKGNALGNMSGSLYGWQKFGAYNVFSDGPADGPCGVGSGPIGTMSPTAEAFNLFQSIAVTGESALSAMVNGDRTNIRAYAATHRGGTALFLFNLNQNHSQPVQVTLSGGTVLSSDVTVITYDKAIYDQSNAATPVWADPKTTDMGQRGLPLTLTLTPWSMNVVIVK